MTRYIHIISRLPISTLFPYTTLFRSDKFTIAALEATLYAYEAGTALETVPTLAMLTEPLPSVRNRARRVVKRLAPDVQIGRATSELQSRFDLVCRLLLEKKNRFRRFC